MDARSAASAYTQSSVESAPPLKVVHMLYEGAIRFLEQAEVTDPQAQPAEFTDRLNRADAIVSELRLCLEQEHAPDLCEQLNALYLFVESTIRDAFLERTAEKLPAAREVLTTLLSAWKEVEVQAARQPSHGRVGS